jgi:hypothetical protein
MNDPEAHHHAWGLLRARFPFYRSSTEAVANLKFYRVTPKRIRWIDNSVSVGNKEGVDLDG